MIHIAKSELGRLKIFDQIMIDNIIAFVSKLEKSDYIIGKIEDDNSDLFCYAQEYLTHSYDKDAWEKHEMFYDVQYILDGSEIAYFNPQTILSTIKEYNSNSDCEVVKADNGECVIVNQGEIIIFEPGEYHNAGVINVKEQTVRKFVIKCKGN